MARRATSFDRIRPVGRANPILSAMQFATNTQRQGGATQNLGTGRLLKGNIREKDAAGRHREVPGTADEGFIVSGEPDRSGKRVPTRYIPRKEATPMEAISERERLKGLTNSPNASLGWWRDRGRAAPVESDASAVYRDRRKAEKIGRRRGEKAIWDNKNQREIRLDT